MSSLGVLVKHLPRMTSYKFVSLKDLDDPESFQSKSVTNITSSEQIHKSMSLGPNGEEYTTRIEKSFSENDISDGKSSSKSEYSLETNSKPFHYENTTKESGLGKSISTDDASKFSFLKDDWSYKSPPSHGDRNFKSSYEKIYNDFDDMYERLSTENTDPQQYQSKRYSSNYEHNDYESDRKNQRASTNREFSFASTIPTHRIPPSHHDKYDSYKYIQLDDFDKVDNQPKKTQSTNQSTSSDSKKSESKTEYDKLEEHSRYLYRPEPSNVKHLIQDEIDFSSLMLDEYAHDKSRNIEDFSKYYFQVHHRNPNKYQQTSQENRRKTESSSTGETKRRTKPIVHYMLPETRTPKTPTQTKKQVSSSKTAPRTCRRDKYCVENYYDVDTKVVNSNLSSNSVYKERVSSSENKKCSCTPGAKTKKPIVIYTYTYENDPSKAVIPPKKIRKPLSKRDIVLPAPRSSKSQSLDNLSLYSTDYRSKRFFDDYQLNKVRRSVSPGYKEDAGSSGYNIPRNTGSSRSCLVTKESSECVTLSSLGNFVQRQSSREGLQKHVTFSDLVSMQSYSDHEEFT